ncbi:hypothetical protein BCR42DRAFT_488686 [Absidia repens]|uniref:UspA domain-containing protein n=1 Tax=Absidia repens TaxID=90262 RepID=A0A1X2ISX5_9FUNG|nr:hypothetical protein BCR42DRAFT_488686 [Absidia repens]
MSAPLSPARIDEDLPTDFLPVGNLQIQVPERSRKIVIAYDHSENSDATFAKVIKLGLVCPSDALYIVHVIEQKDIQNLFTSPFQTGMPPNCDARSTVHSVTEGFLIELKTLLSTNGFHNVTTDVILGDSKESLVDYCRANQPDFLICSSRGLNVVKKVVMGSTSSFLTKNVPCPVLICKLTAEEIDERKKYAGVKRYHFEHLLGAIKAKYK